MQSLKRYGTETQYGTALANNQFVNNQITLTNDDGYVHFLFQNYQFNVTVDDDNADSVLFVEDNRGFKLYMQGGSSLADFTDTEFDVLKYGDKRPTFTTLKGVHTIVKTQYYDTDWKPRFWDYQFCVDEFFNYKTFSTNLSIQQPLKFIIDEGYNELLEVKLSDDYTATFFRKPTTGGNHTKIIMIWASIEEMWREMIVCPTTNPAYSAISSKYDSPNSSNGYTGRELANISDSNFSRMTTLRKATNFDCFRYFTGVTTIPSGTYSSAFFYNSPMTHIVFPKTLTTIGNYAFYYAQSLTEIKLPKSLKTIGESAFRYCSGLAGEFVIPYGVTIVNTYTFYRCSNIQKLVLKGTKTIDTSAFQYCTKLKEVVLPHMLTSIGDDGFSYDSALNKITSFAETVPTVGSNTFKKLANKGVLYRPAGSNYSSWMSTSNYYLGKYGWKQANIT